MSKETSKEDIVRFLLGEMDPDGRELFEVRLFEDPDLFFATTEIENALADGYVRGTLPDDDHHRVAAAVEAHRPMRDKILEAQALKALVESEDSTERVGFLASVSGMISGWFEGASGFWIGLRLVGAGALVVLLASGTYVVLTSLGSPYQVALNESPEATRTGSRPEPTLSASPVPETSVTKQQPRIKEPLSEPQERKHIQKRRETQKEPISASPDIRTARTVPAAQSPPKKEDEPMPEAITPPVASEPKVPEDIPAAAAQERPILDYEERHNDGYVNRIIEYSLDMSTDRSRLGLLDPGIPLDTKVKVFLNGEQVEVLIRLADYFLVAFNRNMLRLDGVNTFELRTDDAKSYHYNLEIVK